MKGGRGAAGGEQGGQLSGRGGLDGVVNEQGLQPVQLSFYTFHGQRPCICASSQCLLTRCNGVHLQTLWKRLLLLVFAG